MTLQDFENEDYLFDPEQYNYIMNMHSPLTNSKLLDNSAYLAYVLKNFHETDPVMLDMLQYYYKLTNSKTGDTMRVTPLHIAFNL